MSQNFPYKSTFYNSNLFCHDRFVHPWKGFVLNVPLKGTRDERRFRFWLCHVQFDSCTPQRLTLQCDADRGDFEILCVLDSWKIWTIDSAVWCTPQSLWCTLQRLTPRWDVHNGDCQGGVIHTAKIFLDIWTPTSVVWCKLSGVHHIAEIDCVVAEIESVVGCTTLWSFLKIWISRRYRRKIIKNTLACLSVVQMGSNHEKKLVINLVSHSL